MNKLLIAIALMSTVLSGAASAEWIEITKSNDDSDTYYADPTTIRQSGDKVKMWILTDYKESSNVNEEKILSDKSIEEFNCKKDEFRGISFYAFSENMGKGNVVFSDHIKEEWWPIPPSSRVSILLKYACKGVK